MQLHNLHWLPVRPAWYLSCCRESLAFDIVWILSVLAREVQSLFFQNEIAPARVSRPAKAGPGCALTISVHSRGDLWLW